jgi:hypothetical protein
MVISLLIKVAKSTGTGSLWTVTTPTGVAGGTTGIGAANAARLGTESCQVVVGDLAADPAQRTAAGIVAAGGTAVAVAFDLASPRPSPH